MLITRDRAPVIYGKCGFPYGDCEPIFNLTQAVFHYFFFHSVISIENYLTYFYLCSNSRFYWVCSFSWVACWHFSSVLLAISHIDV